MEKMPKFLATRKLFIIIAAVAVLFVLALVTGASMVANQNPRKAVALTFDDGPDPRYTPKILAILEKNHIKATFFLIGSRVNMFPNLARQVASHGHLIGNHTYYHVKLKGLTEDQIKEEIDWCEKTIYRVTGEKPQYFRPPKGYFNDETIQVASKAGYKVILWDIAVEHRRSHTPEREAERVLRKVRPGDIILAHDGLLNREKTVKALPLIIEGLKKQGYDFVTLDELLKIRTSEPGQDKFIGHSKEDESIVR
ncbi:MAG: polysaccharide deacetylase family protein [Firmicutes bacterium]|nr:polysaccharide deacetylase family protein [Bacillota bacterium]